MPYIQRKDYLLDQINNLSRVVTQYMDDEQGNNGKKAYKDLNDFENTTQIEEEFGLAFDSLIQLEDEEFIEYVDEFSMGDDIILEQFAELLFQLGHVSEFLKEKYYEKSVIVFDFINITSGSYSLIRNARIERINEALQQLYEKK